MTFHEFFILAYITIGVLASCLIGGITYFILG
jgi:hypothetical protein